MVYGRSEGDECCVVCGSDEGVNGAWREGGRERKGGRGGGEIQTFKPCPWRTTRMTSASSLTLRPMEN